MRWRRRRRRGASVIGVTAAWGGFGLASSAPSAITTCTKVSNGKQAIIPASGAAKCTKKGKGTVTVYDAHSTNVALTRLSLCRRGVEPVRGDEPQAVARTRRRS